MKPVASGCTLGADGELVNDDVERLIAASGQNRPRRDEPYRFARRFPRTWPPARG